MGIEISEEGREGGVVDKNGRGERKREGGEGER